MNIPTHKRDVFITICNLIVLVAILSGCDRVDKDDRITANARYVAGDSGDIWQFNALVWKKTPAYSFLPAGKKCPPTLNEGGRVRFLWNEDYLWVMAEMTDSDLVQESNEDNRRHHLTGDVLELFIRPPGQHCYWEFFATPNQKRSVTFFPSDGRRLPGCLQENGMDDYRIAVEISGSINNYQDRDDGWRCIAAIPMEELRKQCPLDFNAPWEVQVARYNYSVYLAQTEYSQIGVATTDGPAYHCFSSYVKLYLNKKEKEHHE